MNKDFLFITAIAVVVYLSHKPPLIHLEINQTGIRFLENK